MGVEYFMIDKKGCITQEKQGHFDSRAGIITIFPKNKVQSSNQPQQLSDRPKYYPAQRIYIEEKPYIVAYEPETSLTTRSIEAKIKDYLSKL